jgi:hypothetical protein
MTGACGTGVGVVTSGTGLALDSAAAGDSMITVGGAGVEWVGGVLGVGFARAGCACALLEGALSSEVVAGIGLFCVAELFSREPNQLS